METRYPIRKADGTEYQRYEEVKGKLGNEQVGKWLVADNYLWHGGIHISRASAPNSVLTEETAERAIPLQCMAGGDIVALRVNAEYKEAPYGEDQKIKYSSTFVLVRSTHTPDSNKPNSALTFYTLYMHLAPLSDYPLRKIARVIEPTGLKKRTVTSHEIIGQPTSSTTNGKFLKGTLVEVGRTLSFTHNGASKDFCAVRKIENGKPEGDYFWVAAGEDNLQPVSEQHAYLPDWMQEAVRTSTYDSVIIPATPIKISAGSPIGFLGRDDAPNERDEVQADWQSHIEVFSNDSRMPRFLSNPENLTSNDKGWIKAKEGASIYQRTNVDNVMTFTPTEETVSKDDTWWVVEPEQSTPCKDAEGKWWFQFDNGIWLNQEGVNELDPCDLIGRNFYPLEQPSTGDFHRSLVEPWVANAFRWFGSTVYSGEESTAKSKRQGWEETAKMIELYKNGIIANAMYPFFKGLLFKRLHSTEDGIPDLHHRLIVKHDSEWYGKSDEPCWKKVLDECGDKERPWLKQWRDDVEWMSQVDGFKEKAQRQLWHFHPLEFMHAIHQKSQKPIIFPLIVKPENDPGQKWAGWNWRDMNLGSMAVFGRNRDGGARKHAARDLYTLPRTTVVAICDGEVLNVSPFYSQTNEVTIFHQTNDGRKFIIRYGELDPRSITVRRGDKVKQKQVLGSTGKLIKRNGQPEVIFSGVVVFMLHFEYYTGASGYNINTPLTNELILPYKRRRDLADPIEILKEGYNNTFEQSRAQGQRMPIATLSTSSEGKAFIKEWEGVRLRAYDDSEGYCTIGVGHLIDTRRCASFTLPAEFQGEISIAKVDELFDTDVLRFERGLRRSISVDLYQHEFDALVSLLFNCGESFFVNNGAPNMWEKLKGEDYEGAAVEFLDITNGGDSGLVKRRASENNLFLNGIYDATH